MTDRLLPPNSSPLERAVEVLSARVGDIPAPLRALWSADDIDLALLPFLAWALSIDSWNATWPAEIKRQHVRNALAIQRRKGTSRSVRDVVAAFGGQVAVREWFELDPPGEPYTFSMVLNLNDVDGQPASAAFVQEVVDEVGRTKPARAHFTFTQGLQAGALLRVAAAARPALYRRLQLQAA